MLISPSSVIYAGIIQITRKMQLTNPIALVISLASAIEK